MKTIKELRIKKGLTQLQFCQKLNISQSTLSGWESGKWQPDNDTLIKLADFFGVSVDYLLGRDTQKSPAPFNGYEATDAQTRDLLKLFGYMNTIQRAQVYGYAVGLLEQAGANVGAILGY